MHRGGGDRSGGRFQRGPSRWSSGGGGGGGGGGGSPPHRYSRGGEEGGGGGGRFHPYRGSSDYSGGGGGGGGYRGGGGVDDFGKQRHRYGGGNRGGGRGDFQGSFQNHVVLLLAICNCWVVLYRDGELEVAYAWVARFLVLIGWLICDLLSLWMQIQSTFLEILSKTDLSRQISTKLCA